MRSRACLASVPVRVNWPIGCGKNFKGVYDRATKKITTFTAAMGGQKEVASQEFSLEGDEVNSIIGQIPSAADG